MGLGQERRAVHGKHVEHQQQHEQGDYAGFFRSEDMETDTRIGFGAEVSTSSTRRARDAEAASLARARPGAEADTAGADNPLQKVMSS